MSCALHINAHDKQKTMNACIKCIHTCPPPPPPTHTPTHPHTYTHTHTYTQTPTHNFSHPKDITSKNSSQYIEKGIEAFFNPDRNDHKVWNDEEEEEEDNCHGSNENG